MKGVLFDLDGTLLNTLDDLTDSVNYLMNAYSFPNRNPDEVRCFVGNGAAELIRRAVPEGMFSQNLVTEFQEYYRNHCRVKTAPYDGIMEAITAVSEQYPVAIVSNKPDSAVKALCSEYFPGIYAMGQSEQCPRKPDPAMVFQAMKAIGVKECVYVGDSEVDILTASNAGVPCLSVLWGFRERDELLVNGAAAFCLTPNELLNDIQRLFSKREES